MNEPIPKPAQLPDGSYADASKPYSAQDLIGYYPEMASGAGTRSAFKLVDVAGLKPFIEFGDGPIRGARDVEGKLFVVNGTQLCRILSATEYTVIGAIPGRSRVFMDHNQIAGGGNQLAISNGTDGWIYNTLTEEFTRITDAGFPGFRWVGYLQQRFLGIEPQRRFAFNSDEADGLSYDTVERYEAESAPDRLVSAIVSHEQWILGNERTTEFFAASNDPEDIANHIYYRRIPGTTAEVGFASLHCAQNLDNATFFVGSDGNGYELRQYTTRIITPPAISQAWRQCDRSKAITMVYEQDAHKFWVVTFPVAPQGVPKTWVYDVSTQRWHRRVSKGMERWRANCTFKWGSTWYAGSFNSGMIWTIDPDYMFESCDEHIRTWRSGVLHNNGSKLDVNAVEVRYDTGYPETVCAEVEAVAPPEAPAETYVYIVETGANQVEKMAISGFVHTLNIAVGSGPTNIAKNSTGSKLYVCNQTGDSISVIDTATDTVTATWTDTNIDAPFGIAVSPSDAWVFVSHVNLAGDYALSKINASTGAVVDTVTLPNLGNGDVSVSGDGASVYVSNPLTNTMHRLDVATLTVQNSEAAQSYDTLGVHWCTAQDGTNYVLNAIGDGINNQTLKFLNPTTLASLHSVSLSPAQGTGYVKTNAAGTKAFVSGNISGHVSVVDATGTPALAVTTALPGGARPRGVCVASGYGVALVSDASLNNIYKLDINSGALMATGTTAGAGGFGLVAI